MYGHQNPYCLGGDPMVSSITTNLQRFTGEWATLLQPDAILAVCSEIGYTGWRDRVLTPVTTIQLFLLQILHGNTACSHLRHLSGLRFSAAASCQARARLPLRVFDLILLKGLGYVPRVIITDKLASYGVAKCELLPGVEHRQHRYLNNRAENSHQPTRQRGRHMRGLKS